jgi:hypothetical protein
MWVRNLTMQFYLSLYEFYLVLRRYVFEADNFYSIIFIGSSMNGKFDSTKRAISEFFLLKYMKFLNVFEMTFRNNFHMIGSLSIVNNCILLITLVKNIKLK